MNISTTLLIIFALYCIPLPGTAQSDTALYVIQLYTGQTYTGRIVKTDSTSLYFKKEGQGVLILEHSNVKGLQLKATADTTGKKQVKPKSEQGAVSEKSTAQTAVAEDTTEQENLPEIILEAGSYDCFIVTLQGDTQHGKMGVRSDESIVDFQRILRFVDKDKKITLYRPAQLKSFSFKYDGAYVTFQSIENNIDIEVVAADNILYYDVARANSFFFQEVATGHYQLYYLRRIRAQGIQRATTTVKTGGLSTQTSYVVPPDRYQGAPDVQKQLSTYPRNRYAVKHGNGKLIIMEEKDMLDFFQDNPALKVKIADKTYRYRNMPEVIAEYNKWKQQISNVERY